MALLVLTGVMIVVSVHGGVVVASVAPVGGALSGGPVETVGVLVVFVVLPFFSSG